MNKGTVLSWMMNSGASNHMCNASYLVKFHTSTNRGRGGAVLVLSAASGPLSRWVTALPNAHPRAWAMLTSFSLGDTSLVLVWQQQ